MATHAAARRRIGAIAFTLILVVGSHAHAAAAQNAPFAPPPQPAFEVTVYPILAQVPIFGAQIDMPPSDGSPGASGTTDVSLGGAYMFGVIIEGPRWMVDANGLLADVDASHTTPLTRVDSDIGFANLMGGGRIAGRFFAIAGVRRVQADLDITLTEPTANTTVNGKPHAALWDPMLGVAYRGRLTGRTRFDAVFKGGGFGVGTDIDIAVETAVDWHFTRRFLLRVGYSFLYYKFTANTEVEGIDRPIVSEQTLHGPEIGFGIKF